MKTKSKRKIKFTDEEKKEAIAKCLSIAMLMPKSQYEALSPDNHKILFKGWTMKELKLLNRLYDDESLIIQDYDGDITVDREVFEE